MVVCGRKVLAFGFVACFRKYFFFDLLFAGFSFELCFWWYGYDSFVTRIENYFYLDLSVRYDRRYRGSAESLHVSL